MASVTMNVQTDRDLMTRFLFALSEDGISLDSAINRYMQNVVQEHGVPPFPYFSTPETLDADLREAENARKQGYRGHSLEEVLAEMDRVMEEVGVDGT